MKHLRTFGFVLLGMVILFSACEREQGVEGDFALTAPASDPDKTAAQTYLETAWEDGETYEYDTVSGTFNIFTGGTFTAHPESYPQGFAVSVAVPAGAVPTEWASGSDFTITVKVPRWGTEFDSEDSPCPFILEPHGVQFNEPITIWLVLPDELATHCDSGYLFYNLVRTVETGVESFDYQDLSKVYSFASENESVAPPGWQGSTVAGGCANMIRCEVLHFSRWEVEGNGTGSDEPGDG